MLWDKKFRQNRDAPRPSYAWKISMKEFFWNNTKVFSNEMFRYSEIKTSTENLDTPPPPPPPPVIQIFSVPEINETLKDPPTKIFRHCETKKFRRKIVIPLLCIKFFDTPNFLKHWKDAHEIFLHCETKNFRRKIVIPPNMHKLFRYPKFSETFKWCPRNFSALWDKKFSTKSCDTPYYA